VVGSSCHGFCKITVWLYSSSVAQFCRKNSISYQNSLRAVSFIYLYHCNNCTCLVLIVSSYLHPKSSLAWGSTNASRIAQEMQCCRVGWAVLKFVLVIIAIKWPCNNFSYCHVWYRNRICCEVGLTPELGALLLI